MVTPENMPGIPAAAVQVLYSMVYELECSPTKAANLPIQERQARRLLQRLKHYGMVKASSQTDGRGCLFVPTSAGINFADAIHERFSRKSA